MEKQIDEQVKDCLNFLRHGLKMGMKPIELVKEIERATTRVVYNKFIDKVGEMITKEVEPGSVGPAKHNQDKKTIAGKK